MPSRMQRWVDHRARLRGRRDDIDGELRKRPEICHDDLNRIMARINGDMVEFVNPYRVKRREALRLGLWLIANCYDEEEKIEFTVPPRATAEAGEPEPSPEQPQPDLKIEDLRETLRTLEGAARYDERHGSNRSSRKTREQRQVVLDMVTRMTGLKAIEDRKDDDPREGPDAST
jgi:hypothetical protein